MYHHVWAEINLDALRHNINEIIKLVPVEKLMGVVKANAYGHGAGMVSKELEAVGVGKFAVSNVYEALDLRYDKVKGDILILGNIDIEAVKELADNNITICVYSKEYAEKVDAKAKEENVKIKCHIKLDTGMGRLGFNLRNDNFGESFSQEMEEVFRLENLDITGAFTHFATADRDNDPKAKFKTEQYNRFKRGKEIIQDIAGKYGKNNLLFHSSNSAATILDFKNQPSDIYRAGIILYGLTPSAELKLPINLMPVMSLKATVSQIKNISKGDSISYGRTFVAEKNMKVATITTGYADGYMRNLSNKGEVLIGEKLAPIVGRVCMDQTIVDVSDIDDINIGDTVTLFGEGLNVEKPAETLGTINYELVCAVAHRVVRAYTENGKVVKVVRYRSI